MAWRGTQDHGWDCNLRRLNLDGGVQSDLTVHGGPEKAVYAYPFEHYDGWRSRLGRDLHIGVFGENFTTDGLMEDLVHFGDGLIKSLATAHEGL